MLRAQETVHCCLVFFFFFSSRRRHTRLQGDWSSDVCSSDLQVRRPPGRPAGRPSGRGPGEDRREPPDRKSTRLNSSHLVISYAVFCFTKTDWRARSSDVWQPSSISSRTGMTSFIVSCLALFELRYHFFFFFKTGATGLTPPPPPPGPSTT